MAYNGYNNSGGYGYGSSNPYDDPPSYRPTQTPDVEMQPLNAQNPFSDNAGYGGGYGDHQAPARDPNAILNDCREVGRGIDELEERVKDLQRVQRGFVAGNGATNREVDAMGAEIMTGYRALGERVRRIKGKQDARLAHNQAQVSNLDRRIKQAIQNFQTVEAGFRREVQEQQKRQYLIVNPNATEEELREVTEAGGDTQIFQQALLNADRRGQAQSTLRNVQQRHEAIQKIEQTMVELMQLFQDLDRIVVEQEPMIENIEQRAQETHEHMEKGNEHLGTAVVSARKARRKKWMCLGLGILIIIVIAIIVIIVTKAMHMW